jgi:hypothetical protein
MPWTTLQGYALAREIMNGRFDLKPPRTSLSGPRDAASPRQRRSRREAIPADLVRFASLLHTPEGLEHHMARARQP